MVEQILDESDAVGLMQLQCKEAKDDASAMIFPTTDTLPLQQQVRARAGAGVCWVSRKGQGQTRRNPGWFA